LFFSWISPPLGSPIWRYGLIVAAPQTGVVIADTHSNLLLAGTSHFLGQPITLGFMERRLN
jgi:hypothetical protein